MSSVPNETAGVQKPVDPKVLHLGRENGWLRGPSELRRTEEEPKHFGGVQAYANEVKYIPGVTRTPDEVKRKAEELYGPARNPRA